MQSWQTHWSPFVWCISAVLWCGCITGYVCITHPKLLQRCYVRTIYTVWGRVVAPWTPRYYACLSNRVELIFVCSRGTVVCVYVWTRCEPSDAVWAKRRVGLNKTWLCKLCVVSSVDEVQIVSVVCVCVFVCVFVRWCGLLLVRLRGDHMQNRHQSKEQTVWQILITHAVIVIISFTKLACLVVK